MKRLLILIFPFFILNACSSGEKTTGPDEEPKESPKAEAPFQEISPDYTTEALIVPEGFTATILFQKGDEVMTHSGETAPAKGRHDFLAFLPDANDPEKAMLWVNHEAGVNDDKLGDGGGGTFLDLQQVNGNWAVTAMHNADFSNVGGTAKNCLGAVTPWGTILTSEEWEPANNTVMQEYGGIRDTKTWNDRPAYMNHGWMTEVDPVTKKAIGKRWGMGRFMHEGALCMPDKKTVYLMDDQTPGAFFKFIATEAGDYAEGQLYAYQQSADGKSGTWLELPMDRESLERAREEAFKLGATIFIRMEDIELAPDGMFYISETGRDDMDFTQAIEWGAAPALHHKPYDKGNGQYVDYLGRVLKYNPQTEEISVWLEGGAGKKDPAKFLSNPDNMALSPDGKWLSIHEDNNGTDQGRVPAEFGEQMINEVWFLDVSIENPTVDDLHRFAIGPKGCETTGPVWAPDGKTYFFNLQHPGKNNPEPWNKATTVSVTGF